MQLQKNISQRFISKTLEAMKCLEDGIAAAHLEQSFGAAAAAEAVPRPT